MTWWFLLWIPVIYAVTSFTEWYVHKYHMHRKGFLNWFADTTLYTGHAKKHHVVFSPKSDEPTQEELNDIPHKPTDLLKVATLYSVPVGLLGWAVGSLDILLGVPFIFAWCLGWCWLWNWMHVRIHEPEWQPSNAVLRYLKWYHDVHHFNQSKNYNSLALGFDWLMGTYSNKTEPDSASGGT